MPLSVIPPVLNLVLHGLWPHGRSDSASTPGRLRFTLGRRGKIAVVDVGWWHSTEGKSDGQQQRDRRQEASAISGKSSFLRANFIEHPSHENFLFRLFLSRLLSSILYGVLRLDFVLVIHVDSKAQTEHIRRPHGVSRTHTRGSDDRPTFFDFLTGLVGFFVAGACSEPLATDRSKANGLSTPHNDLTGQTLTLTDILEGQVARCHFVCLSRHSVRIR
ncbi:hypothetical protein PMAA_071440 [Talaromyces marneffei ATCC 18224]|uniref:Uncharacterized protein n=1 Tax=Talaromyces marneffei (strain ATCC 18224 / CBS 334.59 / QM 7333) TaxID=441960 RepID=B6Q9B4_TALMQ|nr:hypothetical protein PMAA_071440 [Talaromyces marneffei ATCC 18224]